MGHLMNSLTEYLIKEIENLDEFDGRFSKLKCINYNHNTKEKEGFFSLVFKAYDNVLDEEVIIKIFDPEHLTDAYRIKCFERESKILEKVLDKKRCLQLKKILSSYSLNFPMANGQFLPYCMNYFATEHLPISVIVNFYKNDSSLNISTKNKLMTFRQIVLAIKALHSLDISHRDLKPDNLRGYYDDIKLIIVAIDLGTAVHSKLKNIKSNYSAGPVGHMKYSSPESFSGFAGDREIAFYSDFYSLGCLLYELFSYNFLYQEIDKINKKDYFRILKYCNSEMLNVTDKVNKWNELLEQYKRFIKYPFFDYETCEIPKALKPYLDSLLHGLLKFDYKDRISDFDFIIRKVDIMLKIVEHETYQKYILDKKKAYRVNRLKRKNLIEEKKKQIMDNCNA